MLIQEVLKRRFSAPKFSAQMVAISHPDLIAAINQTPIPNAGYTIKFIRLKKTYSVKWKLVEELVKTALGIGLFMAGMLMTGGDMETVLSQKFGPLGMLSKVTADD